MLETSDETVLSNSSTLKYKEIEVIDKENVRFISLFEIVKCIERIIWKSE